jgi:TPR repeat protein
MYANGKGVSQDDKQAVALYTKACDGGEAGGCFNLGLHYKKGTGVSASTATARRYFKKACDSGYKKACDQL